MTVLTGFELNDLDHDLLDLVRADYRILQVERHPQHGLRYCVPHDAEKWAVPTVSKVLCPGDGTPTRPIEHVLIIRCPIPADADLPAHRSHRLHVTYSNGVRGEGCLKDHRDEPRMFAWIGVIDDGEGVYHAKLPLPQLISEVRVNPSSHLSF